MKLKNENKDEDFSHKVQEKKKGKWVYRIKVCASLESGGQAAVIIKIQDACYCHCKCRTP